MTPATLEATHSGAPPVVRTRSGRRPVVALVAPSLEILGGQGVQARALVEQLAADGYRVLFVPIDPRFPHGLRWLRRVPYARTLLNQLLYLPRLARLARADVVHAFSASYWSFLLAPAPALVAARLLGKRSVLHYHSGEAEDHLERWGALVHPWLRRADELVVPSGYLAGVFRRHGYRAHVVPNVVDTSRFRYRERDPLRPRFLSVRSLEPHYRVDDVIRAFALLRVAFPDATLDVVGHGSQVAALERLADEIAPRGVRFFGPVASHRMPAVYAGADVLLNAAVVDNQPVSVLEAFASGLPVVSTSVGDVKAMLRDGEAGLLVPPGDPAEMAAAAATLLADPAWARALARSAHAELARYSWPGVRDAWSALYDGGRS